MYYSQSTFFVLGPFMGVKKSSESARWMSLSSRMWTEGTGFAKAWRSEGAQME